MSTSTDERLDLAHPTFRGSPADVCDCGGWFAPGTRSRRVAKVVLTTAAVAAVGVAAAGLAALTLIPPEEAMTEPPYAGTDSSLTDEELALGVAG